MIERRLFIAGSLGLALPSWAHHGWSSFDQDRPLYLEGRATKVMWRNPHGEVELELPENPTLPADLKQRPLPRQARMSTVPRCWPRRSCPRGATASG